MPQLDIYTYTSQLFWAFGLFYTFYLIVTFFVLPRAAESLKARHKKVIQDTSFYSSLLNSTESTKKVKNAEMQSYFVLSDNYISTVRIFLVDYTNSILENKISWSRFWSSYKTTWLHLFIKI